MDPDGTVFDSYDLEVDSVIARLKGRDDIEVVGLQFPDGLRDYATQVAERFERALDAAVLINADPTFGACDIALNMERMADVLVHFGHTEMPSINDLHGMEVHFVAARHKAPVADVVVKAAQELAEQAGGKRVGLVTTAQHAHKLQEAVGALADAGFEPVVGRGDNRVNAPGQLLGCNFTAGTSISAHVDGYIYIGSGDFHPSAIRFGTEKPIVLADPYTGEVRTVEETYERIMRQRYAAIAKAQEAQSFGILVGTHVGQERTRLAKGLQKLLRQQGKEAHLIALQFFSWDNLQYFRHLDAFVNTGCPRITTDDYARYPKPMLTPQELEIVLGRREWEDYAFDEFKGTTPAPKGQNAVAMRAEPAGE